MLSIKTSGRQRPNEDIHAKECMFFEKGLTFPALMCPFGSVSSLGSGVRVCQEAGRLGSDPARMPGRFGLPAATIMIRSLPHVRRNGVLCPAALSAS